MLAFEEHYLHLVIDAQGSILVSQVLIDVEHLRQREAGRGLGP